MSNATRSSSVQPLHPRVGFFVLAHLAESVFTKMKMNATRHKICERTCGSSTVSDQLVLPGATLNFDRTSDFFHNTDCRTVCVFSLCHRLSDFIVLWCLMLSLCFVPTLYDKMETSTMQKSLFHQVCAAFDDCAESDCAACIRALSRT